MSEFLRQEQVLFFPGRNPKISKKTKVPKPVNFNIWLDLSERKAGGLHVLLAFDSFWVLAERMSAHDAAVASTAILAPRAYGSSKLGLCEHG
jgi:hypothetical protein